MNKKHKILVVLGTARDGNFSEKVAEFVFDLLKKREKLEVELVYVKDFLFGKTIEDPTKDPKTDDWKHRVLSSKAIVIVSPEYNHSFPGELKILLDALYEEYENKPVLVIGVSSGALGGSRMVESLKPVLVELGFNVLRKSEYFSNIQEKGIDLSKGDSLNKLFDRLIARIPRKND